MRKPKPRSGARTLTPDDWARAALGAIARGGVSAVAVEPIAAQLGATKGSFYWHFKSRDALIEAALREWERRGTDAVIEGLAREPDPAQRLKKLLEGAFAQGGAERAIEITLLANPDHPVARRAVRRVAQRRITYMAEQLEELGWEPAGALDRAVLISYLYVGYLQTAHVAPPAMRDDARQRRHVARVFDTLVVGDLPAARVVRKRGSRVSSAQARGSRKPSKTKRASRRRATEE